MYTITISIIAIVGILLINLGAVSKANHSKRLIPIGFGFMLLSVILPLIRIVELLSK